MLLIYLIAALIFGGGFCIYHYRSKGKQGGAERVTEGARRGAVAVAAEAEIPPGTDRFVEERARIYDNTTGHVYSGMIPADGVRQLRRDFGNLGRKWHREGEWLYEVVRLVDGKYKRLQDFFAPDLANPPTKGFRAITQPATTAWFKTRVVGNVLQRYGWALVFAGVVVFLMFIMTVKAMQG